MATIQNCKTDFSGTSVTYLTKSLKDCLPRALHDVCQVLPTDPIDFIAKWLYRYVDCELYYYQKTIFSKEMQLLTLQMKLDKSKQIANIKRMKKQISKMKFYIREEEKKERALRGAEGKRLGQGTTQMPITDHLLVGTPELRVDTRDDRKTLSSSFPVSSRSSSQRRDHSESSDKGTSPLTARRGRNLKVRSNSKAAPRFSSDWIDRNMKPDKKSGAPQKSRDRKTQSKSQHPGQTKVTEEPQVEVKEKHRRVRQKKISQSAIGIEEGKPLIMTEKTQSKSQHPGQTKVTEEPGVEVKERQSLSKELTDISDESKKEQPRMKRRVKEEVQTEAKRRQTLEEEKKSPKEGEEVAEEWGVKQMILEIKSPPLVVTETGKILKSFIEVGQSKSEADHVGAAIESSVDDQESTAAESAMKDQWRKPKEHLTADGKDETTAPTTRGQEGKHFTKDKEDKTKDSSATDKTERSKGEVKISFKKEKKLQRDEIGRAAAIPGEDDSLQKDEIAAPKRGDMDETVVQPMRKDQKDTEITDDEDKTLILSKTNVRTTLEAQEDTTTALDVKSKTGLKPKRSLEDKDDSDMSANYSGPSSDLEGSSMDETPPQSEKRKGSYSAVRKRSGKVDARKEQEFETVEKTVESEESDNSRVLASLTSYTPSGGSQKDTDTASTYEDGLPSGSSQKYIDTASKDDDEVPSGGSERDIDTVSKDEDDVLSGSSQKGIDTSSRDEDGVPSGGLEKDIDTASKDEDVPSQKPSFRTLIKSSGVFKSVSSLKTEENILSSSRSLTTSQKVSTKWNTITRDRGSEPFSTYAISVTDESISSPRSTLSSLTSSSSLSSDDETQRPKRKHSNRHPLLRVAQISSSVSRQSSKHLPPPIIPQYCQWFLFQPNELVCKHPILGVLRSHKSVVQSAVDSAEYWEKQNFLHQVMYDHEVYTVSQPHADDKEYWKYMGKDSTQQPQH